MLKRINLTVKKIEEISEKKPIKIISHFDTDGITSAAIFSRALQRWGKKFSIQIVKSLNKEFIKQLSEKNALIFLDLASGSLDYLARKKTEVFVFDHHETNQDIPENVTLINPLLFGQENCSTAALCYLFAKEISDNNKDLSTLSVIGMIGDMFDKNITRLYDEIIKNSETTIKRGLLFYPATRPIDKTIEYSTSFYIPEVTGSFKGTLDLLREAGIEKTNGRFKSLAELSNDEMSRLTTAIMLRKSGDIAESDIIGNIYLVRMFNKIEDAREISALINACSRMGRPEIALGFCLGNEEFRKQASRTYSSYKQNIALALKNISEMNKIEGKNYVIVNAKDKIKDTIIGTTASIMSFSPMYKEGTVIVTMAYDKDQIKASARIAGRKGRNVREVLDRALASLEGEVGGHPNAAGCLIAKNNENQFINNLRNILEIDLIKI